MTAAERLRPSWTAAWLLLHSWGLAALLVGGWRWYYVAVAVLEAAGLALKLLGRGGGRMWSPQVWAWAQPDGRVVGWAGFIVQAWTLYFAAAFMVVRPWFGDGRDVGLAGLILLWLAGGHFLHARRARRKAHG